MTSPDTQEANFTYYAYESSHLSSARFLCIPSKQDCRKEGARQLLLASMASLPEQDFPAARTRASRGRPKSSPGPRWSPSLSRLCAPRMGGNQCEMSCFEWEKRALLFALSPSPCAGGDISIHCASQSLKYHRSPVMSLDPVIQYR